MKYVRTKTVGSGAYRRLAVAATGDDQSTCAARRSISPKPAHSMGRGCFDEKDQKRDKRQPLIVMDTWGFAGSMDRRWEKREIWTRPKRVQGFATLLWSQGAPTMNLVGEMPTRLTPLSVLDHWLKSLFLHRSFWPYWHVCLARTQLRCRPAFLGCIELDALWGCRLVDPRLQVSAEDSQSTDQAGVEQRARREDVNEYAASAMGERYLCISNRRSAAFSPFVLAIAVVPCQTQYSISG